MIISSMVCHSCPCPQILDIQAMVEVRGVLDPHNTPGTWKDREIQAFDKHPFSHYLWTTNQVPDTVLGIRAHE